MEPGDRALQPAAVRTLEPSALGSPFPTQSKISAGINAGNSGWALVAVLSKARRHAGHRLGPRAPAHRHRRRHGNQPECDLVGWFGCHHSKGFFYASPLPVTDIALLLEGWRQSLRLPSRHSLTAGSRGHRAGGNGEPTYPRNHLRQQRSANDPQLRASRTSGCGLHRWARKRARSAMRWDHRPRYPLVADPDPVDARHAQTPNDGQFSADSRVTENLLLRNPRGHR